MLLGGQQGSHQPRQATESASGAGKYIRSHFLPWVYRNIFVQQTNLGSFHRYFAFLSLGVEGGVSKLGILAGGVRS